MKKDEIIRVRKLSQKYAYAALQMHETIARQAGFSATDHKYLGFFLQKGNLTAGEFTELTGLSTGAVTGLIDRFEKKELVGREFDPTDRRKVIIVPEAQKIMELIEPFYKEFQFQTDKLIGGFLKKEIDIIASYLKRSMELMENTNNTFK